MTVELKKLGRVGWLCASEQTRVVSVSRMGVDARGAVQPVVTCYVADLRVRWAVRRLIIAVGVFVVRLRLFFTVLKKTVVK